MAKASPTKSITTSLIGIAAGEGLLDLDAPILSFFPGRPIANRDDRKERITVRQLTQNLSGLACVGYPEEVTLRNMAASVDFVQFALDLPMSHEPGTHFAYCSPGMHLLSVILQQAADRTALDFAKEKLAYASGTRHRGSMAAQSSLTTTPSATSERTRSRPSSNRTP